MIKKRRIYKARMLDGKVMLPGDLVRLHKYMAEVEVVEFISDPMRELENYGPSWYTNCRRSAHRARAWARLVAQGAGGLGSIAIASRDAAMQITRRRVQSAAVAPLDTPICKKRAPAVKPGLGFQNWSGRPRPLQSGRRIKIKSERLGLDPLSLFCLTPQERDNQRHSERSCDNCESQQTEHGHLP